MKKINFMFGGVATGMVACALLCAPRAASAAETVYYIDSALSSITLSGQAFGLNFSPLAAGGDVAFLSGTIKADLNGGVLTFSGGSSIVASLNPAAPFTWPPDSAVNGVQNYGMLGQGTVPGYGFAQISGIYRDIILDINSGTAQDGAAPSGMALGFDSGALDYSILINSNPFQVNQTSSPLNDGNNAANTTASLVSLNGTGLYGDTLYLPISMTTSGSNRGEVWTGVIVATVPEPSTLALVGVGIVGLLTMRGRRSH